MPLPMIRGPVTGGSRGHVFGGSVRELAAYGYVEEEYFLEGEAKRFLVSKTPADGRFLSEKEPEPAPYKTRLVVRRPQDPARFNGTVLVLWTNVTMGCEIIDDLEGFTDGFALLAVSAQGAGLEGFSGMPSGLKSWDSKRYGSLHLPGDAYSFDIFGQAARAVGAGGARAGVDPLAGLDVRHRVALGASQSASRLVSFIDAVQPIDPAFDGFVSVVDFGAYAIFDDRVHDEGGRVEYTPEGFAAAGIPLARKRDDVDAKVLVVNSETEARTWNAVEQPDTDSHRVWFVAGAAHGGVGEPRIRTQILERDGLPGLLVPHETPSLVLFPGVVEAAFHAMYQWLETGVAPRPQPRFEFEAEGSHLLRDGDGIIRGGIRLPDVAVPRAVNVGEGPDMTGFAALSGASTPFPPERIRALYPTDEAYVAEVQQVVARLLADGVILQRTADRYLEQARAC
ncbi:alpha/beta hydrolase domain-containing protein [Streptomyces sp. NPDC097610]|uniref:alpha/beta hydrolase domain-containing protein n=1 Tax=Streptomyces sp. NPDC097610 TaxID=3157227 RepID=UPI00331E84A6